MHILVTGAGGFSGSYVVQYLLDEGHKVAAVWRKTLPLPDLKEHPRLHLLKGDLLTLKELPVGTEAVVHTAATSPTLTTRVTDFVRDNVQATDNLVHLARERGVKKFIFFSSLSVYGDISVDLVDEDTPLVNPGAYGASKYFGEVCLRDQEAWMASIAFRLPAVLGRGAARHWLANVLSRARAGEPIHIFNPSAPFNNAVDINDLCDLVGKFLMHDCKGSEVLTLGANGQMSIQSLVSHIIDITGSRSELVVGSVPQHSFTVSSQKAKNIYRYTPKDFNEMLDSYVLTELA